MSAQKPPALSADDLRLVNCAGCSAELLGERQHEDILNGRCVTDLVLPPPVHVRVAGRPYCRACHDGPLRADGGAW